MSKTIVSYQLVLEQEIKKWTGFARALRRDDRESFDRLIDIARSYALEGSNAEQTVVFEPMAMSIIQTKQRDLEFEPCMERDQVKLKLAKQEIEKLLEEDDPDVSKERLAPYGTQAIGGYLQPLNYDMT